jgi:VanZ family protein
MPGARQPIVKTPESGPVWNRAAWWSAVGWSLLATVVLLSLVSIEQPIDVPGADKWEHLLAYGVMMYWWGMVHPHLRWRWAVGLALLGLCLEFAQLLAPGRFMEWRDAAANAAGVLLGLAALATPLRGLLGWLDRQFPNRADPGLT